ncbi:MAG: hypothetical protein JXA78_19955 [Anaerolineales bacterium]|nr:hypothetical protein [Anaerolineales bacterium]
MNQRRSPLPITLILLAAALAIALIGAGRSLQDGNQPIPNSPLYRFLSQDEKSLRYRPVDYAAPIAHVPIPRHPFMAANGSANGGAVGGNNMHNDAYMSDTDAAAGPLGLQPEIRSRTQGFGGYGTLAFDSQGRIVGVYSNARRFQLERMHPYSLEELASYELPPRPWYFPLQGVAPWAYIGAGMYFYLDQADRAVVPTTRNTVQVIQVPTQQDGEFELLREYDLSAHVAPMPWPQQDSVAWALPDWKGGYYWFATTQGVVGTVGMQSGDVQALRLEGEVIENSFAVGEEGVFIISDHALYRFSQGGDGAIVTDWRTAYERGGRVKPGHITRGSGTSVTLLGELVAVTDNAEPRIHLLLVRRADGELVCKLPLFAEEKSGTDITAIGFEHAGADGSGTGLYSIIIENNYGHNLFPFARPEGGITRVDAQRQEDGSYQCREVWTSQEKNIGVFKLSLGNSLLYTYFRDDSLSASRWYFSAIDFASGETVYRQLAGTGLGYDNWAGAIFLHPDGGVAYSTAIFGLVMMSDQ